MTLTKELKRFALWSGADLIGIADLAPFKAAGACLPADLLQPFTRAISIARRLDDEILDRIIDHPTTEYADHYRRVNAELDALSAALAEWIKGHGHRSLAVPASFITDESELRGNISHKAVARMAGIGWQGKSLLIVTPAYGPRIRLATVLTDMPLQSDTPLKNRCGSCAECARACPASAIRCVLPQGEHFSDRDEALFFSRCAATTLQFKAMPGIGARVCGVCVKVCPRGRKKASRGRH